MAYVTATIDSDLIDSDLTNFPIGIRIDSSHNILNGLGATDYEGFHFTVDDVECYAEIDIWDMTEEIAIIWVNVPTVSSSSDTVIKIQNLGDDNSSYVGVIGSTPGQAVWDSNFVAVYHMSQDPSGGSDSILDSTSNEYHGTPSNMDSSNLEDGNFLKGISFDGSTEYITVPNNSSNFPIIGSNSFTIEVFNKPTVWSNGDRNLISWGTNSTKNANALKFTYPHSSDNEITHYFWGADLFGDYNTSLAGVENHVSVTFDGSNRAILVNGTEIDSDTQSSINVALTDLAIGWSMPSYLHGVGRVPFYGTIYEVRISNIDRSEAWLKASAYNISTLITMTYVVEAGDTIIFGQISINEKNVNIIGVSLVEKGQWRTVEEIYMLNDYAWRQNIKS